MQHLRFTIPFRWDEASAVEATILEEVERFQYAPGGVSAVKLALGEAPFQILREGRRGRGDGPLAIDAVVQILNEGDRTISIDATITHKWTEVSIAVGDDVRTIRVPRTAPAPDLNARRRGRPREA